jgi:hypothetical protein
MGLVSSAGLPIIGYSLPIWMVHNTPTLPGATTIYPRYNNSTANTFTFTSSEDYAPAAAIGGGNNAYADFAFQVNPGNASWYNQVWDNNVGRRIGTATALGDLTRVSLYANIDVGNAPHPGERYASTFLAILNNSPGAYHQFQTTGDPTPNYSQPRTFLDNNAMARFEISGQNYAAGAYNSWRCLCHWQVWASANTTILRIINLGGLSDARSMIVIRGLCLIMHAKTGAS